MYLRARLARQLTPARAVRRQRSAHRRVSGSNAFECLWRQRVKLRQALVLILARLVPARRRPHPQRQRYREQRGPAQGFALARAQPAACAAART